MPDVTALPSGTLQIRFINLVGPDAPTAPPVAAPSSTWRNGSGVPSASLGADGDYYVDEANGDIYLRANGAYTVIGNIRFPDPFAAYDGGAPGSTYSYSPLDGGGP